MVIAFGTIGLHSILRIENSRNLLLCCLVYNGVGLGAQFVFVFADAHRQAIWNVFIDTIGACGMIS